ncbi:MAG: glycosyltransferase [Candidatus Competibacteraceae bacterium]|nr:glycosyltransferase [Candidatus Competibacteraceae bacterium]
MISSIDNSSFHTLSVIVPCFNTGKLILDALESIRTQKGLFSIIEILIIDDQSNDTETQNILLELKETPLVRVFQNNRSKGPAGARNTGAFAARGEWLAFLDADDIWLPDSLAARFDVLKVFPDAEFIAGDFQIWDSGRGITEPNFFASRPRPAEFYGPAYQSSSPHRLHRPIRETLVTALCHSCSVLLKRELFYAVGGFEESLMYKEDHHLWFKLAHEADLILVPKSLFLYRQHGDNMTNRVCTPFEYERVMLDFICRNKPADSLKADILKRYEDGFVSDARWFRSRREFTYAIHSCFEGLRLNLFAVQLWKQLFASLIRQT